MKKNAQTSNIFKFAIISNILEWYEFCIYGFLAAIIGELFFKSESSAISLMYVFFVFAISYVARPLGSIFFGYLADRYTRAISLQIATISMSAPTLFIGLLPIYDSIGISAIILLITLRLIQGFAAGGELPTSACMVYETTGGNKKGWLCSSVSLSSLIGILLGSIIAALLFLILDNNTILSWGWRVPFLLGLPITIVIFLMRNYIITNETMNINIIHAPQESILRQLLRLKKEIIIAIIIIGFIQACFYSLFVWLPSYLTTFIHVKSSHAQIINCVGLTTLGMFIFTFGYLTRYFTKKAFLFIGTLGMLLITYPIFLHIPQASFFELILMQIFMALPVGILSSVIFIFLGDMFDRQIRCTGINITYTCGTALIGGTAPAVCTYFINHIGDTAFPAYYICIFALLSLLSLFFIKEEEKAQTRNYFKEIFSRENS